MGIAITPSFILRRRGCGRVGPFAPPTGARPGENALTPGEDVGLWRWHPPGGNVRRGPAAVLLPECHLTGH
jgi:hypothetical protein